jgi:hypothetical protein
VVAASKPFPDLRLPFLDDVSIHEQHLFLEKLSAPCLNLGQRSLSVDGLGAKLVKELCHLMARHLLLTEGRQDASVHF